MRIGEVLLFVILTSFLVGLTVNADTKLNIADDCAKLGVFKVGKQVFECKERK